MRFTSAEKVNWSYSMYCTVLYMYCTFNFIATFRKYFYRRNAPFCCKSQPKSEKCMFLRLWLATIHSGDTNPSETRGHREGVKL
jgi:hypothetical protein